MKGNLKRFLALFLAAMLAVVPSATTFADGEDETEAEPASTAPEDGNYAAITGAANFGITTIIAKILEQRSEDGSDLNQSTGRIDSSTTLEDGVYTPDGFSWSGGTGKVSITCTGITVKNGQTYADIRFSSSKYGYVKADGDTYDTSHEDGGSTVTIPVELNRNNNIIGMTTAMSQAHEVTYTIYIYLAAAAGIQAVESVDPENPPRENSIISTGNLKLDDAAPVIAGMEYEDEVTPEHAEYFRIYRYEGGITLLEIDMTSDTTRDAGGSDMELSQMPVEKAGETDKISPQERTAQLYLGNVVKYLIVPENAEIPAGLEKDVIIVQRPVEKAYAACEQVIDTMEQIGMLDKIAAVGLDEKTCKNEDILSSLKDGTVVFAGTYDEPEKKVLIKSAVDMVIMPSDLLVMLPKEGDAADTGAMTPEEQYELLKELTEQMALLDIPVIVDRSMQEEEGAAQAEWITVYEALFGVL